jgi:hypothetical protein
LPGHDPEVFIDGQTCRLCPLDRLEEMGPLLNVLTPETLAMLSDNARRVGRQFTVARMTQAYQEFLAELRQRRPLRPWDAAAQEICGEWDMTRDNPWLPQPQPVKQWVRQLWGRVVGRGA